MKKILRFVSLAFGLGATVLTVRMIILAVSWVKHLEIIIWRIISFWPRNLFSLIISPSMIRYYSPLAFVHLAIQIGALILAIYLAKELNRSRLDWFVLTLLFPFTLTILSFLGQGTISSKTHGGVIASFFAGMSNSSSTSSNVIKQCSRCGRTVPISSRAGERCPFCGSYWSDERTINR